VGIGAAASTEKSRAEKFRQYAPAQEPPNPNPNPLIFPQY